MFLIGQNFLEICESFSHLLYTSHNHFSYENNFNDYDVYYELTGAGVVLYTFMKSLLIVSKNNCHVMPIESNQAVLHLFL